MARNRKRTSSKIASISSGVLSDNASSKIAKSLAASALSQVDKSKQTGGKLEDLASKVLNSPKYNNKTKILAGSVLSQSNKKR